MSERVSILIRSSARPELAEALASLAAQTYGNLDVVIVNVTGRPHPPLPAAASGLAVNFVDPGRQLPRPLAANAALDAAAGDYVAFLDDDDLFEPEHVANCLAAARAHPGMIPFVGAQISDETGELQAIWPALGFGRLEIVERIRMQTNAPFLPRAALADGMRFDPELPIFEDWDFWIRTSQRMPFRPLPHNTAVCRLGAGTSGTGVGANFDLQRTARDSRPFHAKWDGERRTMAAEFDAACAGADAAAQARDWQEAEALSLQAHALRIWDGANLERLARIADARGDRQRASRFAAAAGRARRLTAAQLTHAQLTQLYDFLREGNARALDGDPAAAEAAFLAALALHEGDQTACNGLANLRIAQGRNAEAEEFLRQGTTHGDRVYPTLLLKRGTLLEQAGRRAEARGIYQLLVVLAPRHQAARDRLRAMDAIAAAAA
ncbi:MAG: glycosyltransferase family 2 protein [Betaproteobacteria bacterium]|nr:glycosyltransferase family 2 protein [Betaproteobacteria bacterium]